MTPFQKKCFVVSSGFHGLLLVILVVTAAFRSEPVLNEAQVLDFISPNILDRAGSGGEPPPVAKPQPPQAEKPPAVSEPAPQPHETPTPKQSQPQRVAARSEPTEPRKPAMDKSSLLPTPHQRHSIVPEFNEVYSSKKPTAKSDSTAQAQADAQAEARRSRANQIASALNSWADQISTQPSKSTVVSLPGQRGGEAFVGYENAIFNAYYHAWRTPDETTDRQAVADVKIVVARDGSIISAEIITASGNSTVDRSVQRALDAVKHLPAFPEKSSDTERSFLIRFNLQAKQSSG